MSLVSRLFARGNNERDALRPLYDAIVAEGRAPAWYREGGVPDTLDGRFDMIAAVLAVVLLRLEAEDEPGRVPGVMLTELFVDDMDGQLRQIGIGDVGIGKHVGRMMSALGGRLTAYRQAFAAEAVPAALQDALVRNLWRGAPPDEEGLSWTAAALRGLRDRVWIQPLDALLAGSLAR